MVMKQQWACGHPRLPENTSGSERPQCRECKITRQRYRYANDPEYRESRLARMREEYEALDGVSYNRRLLRLRRQKALARRRARELRMEV